MSVIEFQCSSASRKFLNSTLDPSDPEPYVASFSALQRAENSSIGSALLPYLTQLVGFSALQRAENSSMAATPARDQPPSEFQCSSASRKFLNFSTLVDIVELLAVSVLFSEPKIPQSDRVSFARTRLACFSALQRAENSSMLHNRCFRQQTPRVSVLFSEPKIPQLLPASKDDALRLCFSALQRAENSSICSRPNRRAVETRFQCSSASRKFLNCTRSGRRGTVCR